MIKRGRVSSFFGSVIEAVIGRNPHIAMLKGRSESGLILSDVLDFKMYLDVNDLGLSRTLLKFGVREETSTGVFRRELGRLAEEVEGEVTVLDLGSNIGYFVLNEAMVLGDGVSIHAIEPVPYNVDILRKNIELNELSDRVSVSQVAIGTRNGTMELHLAERSNRHSLYRSDDHSDSVLVDTVTPDQFLCERGVPADAVNVLRLDVDGYEVEIFRMMDEILASSSPLLVFTELHPGLRDSDELCRIPAQLERHGFEIVSTTIDKFGDSFDRGWSEKPADLTSFPEIVDHLRQTDGRDKTLLLIAYRDGVPPDRQMTEA